MPLRSLSVIGMVKLMPTSVNSKLPRFDFAQVVVAGRDDEARAHEAVDFDVTLGARDRDLGCLSAARTGDHQ